MESNEQDQLLIKADLPEETGKEQDESDLNNLPKWLDEVKADHKIRTNDGDLGGTPTQLNFKQSVAFCLL